MPKIILVLYFIILSLQSKRKKGFEVILKIKFKSGCEKMWK